MTVDAISNFIAEIDATLGTYLDMRRGFGALVHDFDRVRADFLSKTPGKSADELDKLPFSYTSGDPEAGSYTLHECTQEEYRERNSPSGENATRAGNMCVVHLYQLWEGRYRNEIARDLGIAKDELVVDFFGDLRLLRHSIIHHNAVALPDVGRCKVIKWFKPEVPIWFTRAEFLELVKALKQVLTNLRLRKSATHCHT